MYFRWFNLTSPFQTATAFMAIVILLEIFVVALLIERSFAMCGVFAEFERSIIRERITAGLTGAKANGQMLGRPKVGQEVEEAIRQALSRGDKGMRKIAREVGVGVSVVQRVKVESAVG